MLTRLCGVLVLCLLVATSWAADGVATVTAFPSVVVADGRSTITVTVEVRDGNGKLVPDGTQVVLESTLGNFREPAISTQNGFARGILIAGTTPGIAKITASVLAFRAVGKLDFEFVKDKSELSTATEFFEVSCPRYLAYFPEKRMIAAAAPKKEARVRLRGTIVEADDLQLELSSYRLRARKARLTLNRQSYTFDQLSYDFRTKKGYGVTSYEVTRDDGSKATQIGPVEIVPSGIQPIAELPSPNLFQFEDLSAAQAQVAAKRIIAYPSRDIQFQRADVYINAQRIMRVPLYQMAASAAVPTIGDQFLEISNNQPAVNYPYYLSLRPGFSSLVRFRYGQRFSSGVGAAGGTLLDFETAWSAGDDRQGSARFTGAGRKDWGVTARQAIRWDDKTMTSFQLDFPANSALYGSVNASRLLPGWTMNYNGNVGRATRGQRFDSQSHFLMLEKDSIQVGKLPLRLYNGLTAQRSQFRAGTARTSQTGYGVRSRLQSDVLRLNSRSSISANFSVSALGGRNVSKGLTTSGLLSFWSQVGRGLSTSINYDFLNDPVSSQFVGRHRLTTNTSFYSGNFDLNLYGSKSLDVDRVNGTADASYRFSKLWRLSSLFSVDRYRGTSFNDYSFVIGYNLGLREIGLSWSNRTRRLGIELLGTPLR